MPIKNYYMTSLSFVWLAHQLGGAGDRRKRNREFIKTGGTCLAQVKEKYPASSPPFSGLHEKSKATNTTNYKAHLCKKQRFQVTQHKNSNLKRLTGSCEPFPTGAHSSERTSKRLCLGRRQLTRPLVRSALHSGCAFTLQHQTFVPLVPLFKHLPPT